MNSGIRSKGMIQARQGAASRAQMVAAGGSVPCDGGR